MDELLSGSLPKWEMWPAKQLNLRLDVQLLTASVLGAIRDLCISAAKRRVAECQCWKLSRRQATPFELRWNHKVKQSEKAQPTSKRVEKIIHYLTYKVHRSWYNELIRWWCSTWVSIGCIQHFVPMASRKVLLEKCCFSLAMSRNECRCTGTWIVDSMSVTKCSSNFWWLWRSWRWPVRRWAKEVVECPISTPIWHATRCREEIFAAATDYSF